MHRAVWASILTVAAIGASTGVAQQDDPGRAPGRLAVITMDRCGGGQAGTELRSALRARLPNTEMVSGSDIEADIRLYWRAGDRGRCRLELEGTEYEEGGTLAVELEPAADGATIRNAASRVAWILTAREPPRSPDPEEAGDEQTGGERDGESESEGASRPEQEEAESESSDGEMSDQSDSDSAKEDDSEADSGAEREVADRDSGEAGGEGGGEPSFSGGTVVPVRATLLPLVSVPVDAPEEPVPVYAFNVVGSNYGLRGLEFGLLFNTEGSYADGVQMAGLGNWVSGPMRGVQASGLLNVDTGSLRGVSAAGLGNVSAEVRGLQLAVAPGNLSLGEMRGMQASSGVNFSTGAVTGLQLGAVNVARDVSGFQGGLVNVGADVEGMQLGIANIAAESTASVGALNINWNRPAYVHVWTNELLVFSTGLQHGSRYFQNLLRFGYRPFGPSRFVTPGIGFAGHVPFEILGEVSGYLDVDVIYNVAVPTAPSGATPAHWGQARWTGGFRLGRRVAVYSGASFNVAQSIGPADSVGLVREAIPFSDGANGGPILWPGFFGGVRF